MKKLLSFILISGLSCLGMNAQIISNKIDLSLGYGFGKFGGDEMINEDGFIAPALYSNYDSQYGISIKGIILKKQRFSFGFSMNYTSAYDWNTDLYTDYANSSVLLYSISPIVQIQNKPAETGFFNRFRIFLEIAPAIGLSKLSLSSPLFDIHNGIAIIEQPAGSNDLYYGLKGAAGIQASINQLFSIFIETTSGYYLVSSSLYTDSDFLNFSLEAGVIIKLKMNRRFFY